MPSLAELALAINGSLINSNTSEQVSGVHYDSRKISSNDAFVAISGHREDGAKYIQDAFVRGAIVLIQETKAPKTNHPTILVENARVGLAKAAWYLAGYPNKDLRLVGVTGTNGKTTVAVALAQLLGKCGHPTGVCGTLGMFFNEFRFDSDRTTAEAPELADAFRSMKSRGAKCIAMEATSIGLELKRLDELRFEVGVFTNLSRDHLDFHGSWENYRKAKLMLFDSDRLVGTAVINADDPESGNFIRHTTRRISTFGIQSESDFRASAIHLRADGTEFQLQCPDGGFQIHTSLVGRFNVYNTLAIIASANAMGVAVQDIVEVLPEVTAVRGRAEVIKSNAPFSVLVDYAHTPDALEKILSTVKELTDGTLHCVVGAGGDRDRGKRPLMAQIAQKWSDRVYLTSDNPRTENPTSILDEMLEGISNPTHLAVIPDRRQAIYDALACASDGDVIVVAGKGHETYQEIHGVKHPFDDAEVIRSWFRSNGYLQ